ALWRSGALALWRSGALALWRSGALALWRSGALALHYTKSVLVNNILNIAIQERTCVKQGGDGLEEGLLGAGRRGLAPPNGREHAARARTRLVDADRVEIVDDIPDARSPV
ncbi:MAG: hypothetical protein OXH92_08215, partial [Bryobacterales bacterium]|nr:hypothetical protein [Bryobacterales bacterium]